MPDTDHARRVAIDHHHDVAHVFDERYQAMSESRFASAFAYGRRKVDLLLERELKSLEPHAKVLDVGCGNGVYLQRFAELGLVPLGLEPAEGMIQRARERNPGVRIEQGVSTALPFEDASIDAITAIEVYRYLDEADIRASFVEARRVLRPGGFFFSTMVNRWALDGFYVLQRLRQTFRGVEFDRKNPHCTFSTPSELRRDLRAAGFADVRTEGRLFAPMRMLYKANRKLAGKVAERVETLDDTLHERIPATTRFAGHLVCVARA